MRVPSRASHARGHEDRALYTVSVQSVSADSPRPDRERPGRAVSPRASYDVPRDVSRRFQERSLLVRRSRSTRDRRGGHRGVLSAHGRAARVPEKRGTTAGKNAPAPRGSCGRGEPLGASGGPRGTGGAERVRLRRVRAKGAPRRARLRRGHVALDRSRAERVSDAGIDRRDASPFRGGGRSDPAPRAAPRRLSARAPGRDHRSAARGGARVVP